MVFNFLAAGPIDFITGNLAWILGGLIVIVGLFVIGLSDLLRLSPSRIWAISGVSFQESIRRRVLWITPLAILGVLVVAGFQKALDPQDAIRQTTKVCLFATGVVVIVTTIILACTSLPKEIDNRVIYTVVTKPTTRLEIVLGKIVGFARVSATILLIMGLFTFGYLKLREAGMVSAMKSRLATDTIDPAARPMLEYYSTAGLLGTKSMELADSMQVMAAPPEVDPDAPRRVSGSASQYYALAFDLTDQEADVVVDAVSKGGGLFVVNTIGYEHREPTEEEARQIEELALPLEGAPAASPVEGPALPSAAAPAATQPAANRRPIPQIQVQLLDAKQQRLVPLEQVNGGKSIDLQRGGSQPMPAPAFLTPEAIEAVVNAGRFYVTVYPATPAVDFLVGPTPTVLVALDAAGQTVATIQPVARDADAEADAGSLSQPTPAGPTAPVFLSNQGRYGMQIMGRADAQGPVAVYHYAAAEAPQAQDGMATVEVRSGIEGSPVDYTAEGENVIRMSLQVRNAKSGQTSEAIPFVPENDRVAYVRVPAELLAGGEYDVFVRALENGQWFGLKPESVTVVTADRSFAVNLAKSLLTLWFMAILVVVISVFCSTFLSWPIAVVLTLVILLGHWGVTQVQDAAGSGLGAEVTQGLGLDDPASATIVRTSVNALTQILKVISAFLPDISKFSVTEDIERGISIPPAKMLQGLGVLLGYGLPMTVLAYVFLKRKEVAP